MKRWEMRTCLIAAAIAIVAAVAVRAQDTPADRLAGDKAVEAGHDALRRSASFPWYDAEEDRLRDVQAKAKKVDDSSTRKDGWEVEPRSPKATATSSRAWSRPSFGAIAQYAALGVLALLVIGLTYLLIRYFLKDHDEVIVSRGEERAELSAGEVDRVEQLPFHVRRPESDLLSEARRLYELQQYGEAMIYLYSYELVQLDKHQHIQLAKGKTNRQYLREVREQPTLREILYRTMIAFEDAFFGHHALDRARFETSWGELSAFQQALPQGAAA